MRKKGIVKSVVIIFLGFTVIFSLLSFVSILNTFSNYDRFYVFWQGYYLADSFIVKFYTNKTSGELLVNGVPFENSSPFEVGKSWLQTNILSSPYPYRYTTKIKLSYSNGIEEYVIISKYLE